MSRPKPGYECYGCGLSIQGGTEDALRRLSAGLFSSFLPVRDGQLVPYICHVRFLVGPPVGRHAVDMIGLRGSDQQKVEQQISIIRIVTDNTDYRGTKIIIQYDFLADTVCCPEQFVGCPFR